MLAAFQKYIEQENLFRKDDRILLAVSGGVDSMVMADLFLRTGFPFGLAHCNFQLRGIESDEDESFVRKYADRIGREYFSKRFNTRSYANEKGISLQMTARTLRRDWFSEILKNSEYTCYATAHHLDDQNETFFINLLRGTGIRGLHGILPIQGRSIHPMLFAWRQDIETYAGDNKLAYREDSTNKKTDYLRNKIRHEILPQMVDINPTFANSLRETIHRLRNTDKIYTDHLKELWDQISESSPELIRIHGDEILKLRDKQTYLFEFLNPFGFSSTDVDQILPILPDGKGQQFYSATHRLILNRQTILISEKKDIGCQISDRYLIYDNNLNIQYPISLELSVKQRGSRFRIDPTPGLAQFNAEMIRFPLEIRKWREGDRFVPLGMKGTKLISDFFVDEKFSLLEKEKCWLLLSNNDVIWIIGYRINEQYKVTPDTKQILEVKLTGSGTDKPSGSK